MYIHLKRIVIGRGEEERMGWVQKSQRVYRVVEGNDGSTKHTNGIKRTTLRGSINPDRGK